jgi:hypothetical protein
MGGGGELVGDFPVGSGAGAGGGGGEGGEGAGGEGAGGEGGGGGESGAGGEFVGDFPAGPVGGAGGGGEGGEGAGAGGGGGGERTGGGGGGGGGLTRGVTRPPVVQPSAAINVRSVVVNTLIWPAGLKARKASAPALAAQSLRSPVGFVLKLSRFVAPPLIEK